MENASSYSADEAVTSANKEAKQAWLKAMNAVQAKLKPVPRTGVNPMTKSRYSRLEDIIEHLRAPLTSNGLLITFDSSNGTDGEVVFELIVMHVDGYQRTFKLFAPPIELGNKMLNSIQAMGSRQTYCMRYLLVSTFALSGCDADDDGNTAQPAKQATKPVRQQAPKAKKPKLIQQGEINKMKALLKESQVDVAKFVEYFKKNTLTEFTQSEAAEGVKLLEERIAKRNEAKHKTEKSGAE